MQDPRRSMALTQELVERAHRDIQGAGRVPDLVPSTDEDHAALAQRLLAGHPQGADLWVFAYGSLLWKPAFEHVDQRRAVARGWHRAFRLRMRSGRGTVERPGLMMGLDMGGQCAGIALRIAATTLPSQLIGLLRREMPVRPVVGLPTNAPRWITVATENGLLRAVAFVLDRRGASYAGRLTPDETADMLAHACGHAGSCADYLYQTVTHLEQSGIHDRHLWRLQALVAERLARIGPAIDSDVA